MANPGHSGPKQDRPTQGNNQVSFQVSKFKKTKTKFKNQKILKFFGRPIRPENQPVPSTPMAGGSTTNPNPPSSAPQALPYTGLNVNIFFLAFIIMDDWLMHCFSYNSNPFFLSLEINSTRK